MRSDGTESPSVVSVNAGSVREVEWLGRRVTTGIFKSPVDGRRRVEGVNLVGDDQADRSVHGGPTKSLYLYAAEDYAWWADQLGRALAPGTFGENVTVEGTDPAAAVIGERWRIGSALVRVTEPRIPCYKLGIRMEDPRFPPRFAAAGRPGTYLAIEQAGDIGAGDAVTVIHRPAHGVTIGDVERAYHADRDRLALLVDVDELSDQWRGWARAMLDKRTAARGRA